MEVGLLARREYFHAYTSRFLMPVGVQLWFSNCVQCKGSRWGLWRCDPPFTNAISKILHSRQNEGKGRGKKRERERKEEEGEREKGKGREKKRKKERRGECKIEKRRKTKEHVKNT